MNNATNLTESLHFRNYEQWYAYLFAAAYSGITAVAVCGNLLVCCAVALNKNLRRSPTNLFILSLAFSDLLTALFAMPFDVEILLTEGQWDHGEVMCRAWTTVYLLTVPTSIFTLLAVSIDRYKTLSDPLNRFRRSRFMTRKRAGIVIIVLWAYCLIMSLLPVVGAIKTTHPTFMYNGQCVFPLPYEFSAITTIVNFVAPLFFTCAIYAKIYRIARLHPQNQQKIGRSSIQPQDRKDYMRNIRAAKTISMFVCAFLFCWVPYCTISIVSNLCITCYFSIPPEVYPPLLMLGYLNSALNPFLFSFRNKAFRSTFWRLYRTIRRKKRRHSRYPSRNTSTMTRRSDAPDHESGTDVYMFSVRSRSESTPDCNPHDTPIRDDQNNDVLSTSGSREPLSSNDKLQTHVQMQQCPYKVVSTTEKTIEGNFV